MLHAIFVTLLCSTSTVLAQGSAFESWNITFNSSYELTASQIALGNLTSLEINNIEVGLNFERTNWANGSVEQDSFYDVPANASSAPPGSLLKVQEDANTSSYTLPPNTALSRILFQSETLNGTAVPASAYVLWPWMARDFSTTKGNVSGIPTVGWAHGTSGIFGACGPSHIRLLWYQFAAPFELALQGYAVVGVDYAGLGADRDQNGQPINFTYVAGPAHANDMFYAVQAAQTAFPELSKEFVMVGHSEGGGAAWACAERQAQRPVKGHLGTVAGSPVTDWIGLVDAAPEGLGALSFQIAQGIKTVFPEFELSDFLTQAGQNRFELLRELQGCQAVIGNVWSTDSNVDNWQHSTYAELYKNLVSSGGKEIGGPLLVIQGTADSTVPENLTSIAVNATCSVCPQSQLQYATFEGATHVPVMFASQQVWLDWIAARFAGEPVAAGCSAKEYKPARSVASYQAESNYVLEYALQGWAAS